MRIEIGEELRRTLDGLFDNIRIAAIVLAVVAACYKGCEFSHVLEMRKLEVHQGQGRK